MKYMKCKIKDAVFYSDFLETGEIICTIISL